MAQDEIAIPIVFIRDSKHAIALSDLEPVRAYADQEDGSGIEEVIRFLTQADGGQ